jgi:hypothetical protein
MIDPRHPWVAASLVMEPMPLPVNAKFDRVTIPVPSEDDPEKVERVNAARLTVVAPTGVQTYFLPPQLLGELIDQGTAIWNAWVEEEEEKQNKIQVASTEMMKQVTSIHEGSKKLRGRE